MAGVAIYVTSKLMMSIKFEHNEIAIVVTPRVSSSGGGGGGEASLKTN
jgi:hypothetical protein